MTVWTLRDFLERFDEWVERENPPENWAIGTMAWIHGLLDDPYSHASRHPEWEGWWFSVVPGAQDHSAAVVCLYRVDEARREARCSTFSILSKPIA